MGEPRIELAQVLGRAALLADGRVVDLERRSGGAFTSDPMAALARWDELCAWAERVRVGRRRPVARPGDLGPCVPRPSQVFAIGLNYRDHAVETGLPEPKQPMVFTKFANCLTGRAPTIELTSDAVDWEVELVVVIGKRGAAAWPRRARSSTSPATASDRTSRDRRLQFADTPPQFSLGKSRDGFGPIGPERRRAPQPRIRDVRAALRRRRRRACRTARPTT